MYKRQIPSFLGVTEKRCDHFDHIVLLRNWEINVLPFSLHGFPAPLPEMCIRDSLGGFRVNLHRGADVLVSHDVLNNLQAVSYTHLDVYKRQAVGRPDPRPFLHNPHHRVAASR